MRTIKSEQITESLANVVYDTLCDVEPSVNDKLARALDRESSPLAKFALATLVENNRLATITRSPACQDTGLSVVFVEMGQSLIIEGDDINNAINEGIRRAYALGGRKSVCSPLTRINTTDNTPAIIHYSISQGEHFRMTFLAKGAGSENMGKLYMLTPSKGREGIIASVLDCVTSAGANPCPPIIVGVGIGGTMEKATLLSKFALTRKTGISSQITENALLETDLLTAINNTKIGANGLGGNTTCLGVMVESFPTHIGMLPVAVNLQCHCVRHTVITI